MSALRFAFQPQAVTETVWGPGWPLLLVLLGFPGLLALLFAAGSRDDLPLIHGIFGTLAVGSSVFAVCGTAWAVHRQARVQRIWAARLAPLAASHRVSKAVALGLALAWTVTALPILLLGAAQGLEGSALAGASLLAMLMLASAAWACAWQGRLPWIALVPASLAAALTVVGGPSLFWGQWIGLGAWGHGLAVLASAWALPQVLEARPRAGASTPAMAWARLSAHMHSLWQRKYRRVQERGEAQSAPWWVGGAGYPIVSTMNLGPLTGTSEWAWLGSSVMGVLTAAVFLSLTYANLMSTDLHWRQWLAPGAHLRQALGLRVLAQSFVAHARIGLVLVVVVTAATALWPWGDRVSNLVLMGEGMAASALHWLLALPAAVCLRGWRVSPARRLLMALGLVLAWLVVGMLLVWVGIHHRGPLLLCLVAISGLALLPCIQWAWRQRDLADFMPQRDRNLETLT